MAGTGSERASPRVESFLHLSLTPENRRRQKTRAKQNYKKVSVGETPKTAVAVL